MTVDLTRGRLATAIADSNLADSTSRPAALEELVDACCRPSPNSTDDVVAVSKVGCQRTPDGHARGTDEVVLVVFPIEFAIARRRGVLRKRVDVEHHRYQEFKTMVPDRGTIGPGARTGEYGIDFLGHGDVRALRLAWSWWCPAPGDGARERMAAAEERDRVLAAMRDGLSHALGASPTAEGPFADAFRSSIEVLRQVAPGPEQDVHDAAVEAFGDFGHGGPVSCAVEWRRAELEDADPSRNTGGLSSRTVLVWQSFTSVRDHGDAARHVWVELAADLHAEGVLRGPYDERSDFGPGVVDDPQRPLSPYDPGPSRLAALVTLATYARDIGHPGADAWVAEANAAIGSARHVLDATTGPPRRLATSL